MESTEEDGVNSVVEQFYNELVKRQRDVLCCKSGVAGPTQPHCACMPSIAHPLAKQCISPFQWRRESWRLGEPAREKDRSKREGKRKRPFYDTWYNLWTYEETPEPKIDCVEGASWKIQNTGNGYFSFTRCHRRKSQFNGKGKGCGSPLDRAFISSMALDMHRPA